MSDEPLEDLTQVPRVGSSVIENLRAAGYETLSDLAGVDRATLSDISGIGSSTADNIVRFLAERGYREEDIISRNQQKLQEYLRELFEYDTYGAGDLDFGIYAVLNQKRDEIESFIEEVLIEKVNSELQEYERERRDQLEEELEDLADQIRQSLGEDAIDDQGRLQKYEDTDIGQQYNQLRQELREATDTTPVEARVFNDLYQFFSRYYDSGDFMPQQRYTQGTAPYAIPYSGDETHFHWANKGQYYIKTTEQFQQYQFSAGGFDIEFVLAGAQVAIDNRKTEEDRYFFLVDEGPVEFDADNESVTAHFEYREFGENEFDEYEGLSSRTHDKQAVLREHIHDTIIESLPAEASRRLERIASGSDETVLKNHLHQYMRKHNADYFIHPNLGEFLRDELDRYIKEELTDAEMLYRTGQATDRQASRCRMVHEIGRDIIQFLEQIEAFQLKIFEKKKFVLDTEYCVTVDRVPEPLRKRALDNEAQVEEWRDIVGVDDEGQGLNRFTDETTINDEFLKSHPGLMIDTRYFDEEFKYDLLATFGDLDEALDGHLITGENYQALDLLSERFQDNVSAIYIDPPYNTGNEFVYKDDFQHSSWLSMVQNRIEKGKELLADDGLFFSSIDDNEVHNLMQLLRESFDEYVNTVAVQTNPKGRGMDRYLAREHDYLLCCAQQPTELAGVPKSDEEIQEDYSQRDEGGLYRRIPLRNTHREFHRGNRPNLWYPLYVDTETGEVYLEDNPDRVEVYPTWSDGFEGCWTWDQDKATEDRDKLIGRKVSGEWKVYRKDYARENGEDPTYTPKTIWDDRELHTEYAQGILDDVLGERAFTAPKPPALVERAVQLSSADCGTILDFFAGSGTTAHAVLNLERQDYEELDYILVDMGSYLEDIAKERIKRVVYSDQWEEGSPETDNPVSHMFRYQVIESYDDALNNIHFDDEQQTFDDFQKYKLKYMLDFESRDSPTRLDVDQLSTPFQYELELVREGRRIDKTVDLIETFNYLLGLHVEHIESTTHQDRTYRRVRGETPSGETVAVVWRRTTELDYAKDRKFIEEDLLTGNEDLVYCNGDSMISGAIPVGEEFVERLEPQEL